MSNANFPAAQRRLRAARAADLRWAHINSPEARSQATSAARAARQRSWEEQADPNGVLSPEELAAAVRRLKSAHYRLMALRSAEARSGRGAA